MSLLTLVLGISVLPAYGQSIRPQRSSAESSPSSATAAANDASFIGACAAAADDLKASRRLAAVLEKENDLLTARLETSDRTTALLTELEITRKSEAAALRSVIEAKDKVITAKDSTIAAQAELIATLKKKKSSPLRRLGDILIGVAVFAVLK